MNSVVRGIFGILLLTGAVSALGRTTIEEETVAGAPSRAIDVRDTRQEWVITLDNDVLVPGSRDQDYTYGLNLNITSPKVRSHVASLHRPLRWVDSVFGLSNTPEPSTEIEYGLFGFTPEDISQSSPQAGDRPYASLIYTTSRHVYAIDEDTAVRSSLSIGALGLPIVGELQTEVHNLTSGDDPRGWSNQISDGGELTAKYSIAFQHRLLRDSNRAEVKSTAQASLGYISELSWGLSARLGKLQSGWDAFNPELAAYGEKSAPVAHHREHFFWTGFAIKARAYNAFLQGQFRDSVIHYGHSELRHWLAEAWAGYTVSVNDALRVSYYLRGHTSEIKSGIGDRNVLWGGLQLAKTL